MYQLHYLNIQAIRKAYGFFRYILATEFDLSETNHLVNEMVDLTANFFSRYKSGYVPAEYVVRDWVEYSQDLPIGAAGEMLKANHISVLKALFQGDTLKDATLIIEDIFDWLEKDQKEKV